MEATISNDDRVAIAEVDYIIHHMNERYLNMIPDKVRLFISVVKNQTVEVYVDPRRALTEQGLKEFTLYFLLILNLKYWASEERKEQIMAQLKENQRKYDERVNNIFKQANEITDIEVEQEKNSVEEIKKVETENINENKNENVSGASNKNESIAEIHKESFFEKIVNKFKNIFSKKASK